MNNNIVSGIQQLAKATEVKKHLPADLPKTLEALFAYRNFMFHNGFVWPEEKCAAFAARIEKGSWQGWFTCSEPSDKPWIFYMNDEFTEHCLEMVGKVLESFGKYCKGRNQIQTIPVELIPGDSFR